MKIEEDLSYFFTKLKVAKAKGGQWIDHFKYLVCCPTHTDSNHL